MPRPWSDDPYDLPTVNDAELDAEQLSRRLDRLKEATTWPWSYPDPDDDVHDG